MQHGRAVNNASRKRSMVVAGPDVEYALAEENEELAARVRAAEVESL